jgi:beta-N-acetylhexosaminidase
MHYGRLMLDVAGLSLTANEREILHNPHVGGLILFARNYQSKQQLAALVADIRQQNDNIVIAVDQEGGRVQRFREQFTLLPPMYSLHDAYQKDPNQACEQAVELGWLMATELIAMDIDISLAPVLDLHWNHSSVIGNRAFGDTHQQVSTLAGNFMQGMKEAGMKATGKHFPGHGWAVADSHLEAAIDERTLEQIDADDLQPFKQLIKEGLAALMPAHVIYSQVDNKPAGYSEYWLKTVLREQLKFNGVIFSDDLNMEGAEVTESGVAQGAFASRAAAAIEAGCDTVLMCNNSAGAQQVLAYLMDNNIAPSERLGSMRATKMGCDSKRKEKAVSIAQSLKELCA